MKALKRSTGPPTSSSSSAGPSSSSGVAVASSPPSTSSWIHLRSLLIVASHPVPDRGSLKSPWSRRKRKHLLSRRRWQSLFSSEGKLYDGGVKFLRKVRSGGVDPCIRADVWPFLLGVYDLKSSEADRIVVRTQKRKEYEKLRKKCQQLQNEKRNGLKVIDETSGEEDILNFSEGPRYNDSEDDACARSSLFNAEGNLHDGNCDDLFHDGKFASNFGNLDEEEEEGGWYGFTHVDLSPLESESSDSETSGDDEHESLLGSTLREEMVDPDPKFLKNPSVRVDFSESNRTPEDFATWQRIIGLDAIRANADWMVHCPAQSNICKEKAIETAVSVGLKNYDHLEPRMIYHAARLVAVLEAYAVYDPETGYCQGMSDLLSPILSVIEDDYEAFWCFVGFMKKARYNFRLDESGIRRQLNIVSKIIKCKDSHLYRHLEKLQAEDCCFVYRMVVVLFRRELTFEQTVCLWEVMWADQAAIRAGIGKSAWGRIRLRAPPTDDLLLYAIAACVLQRRKLIIEKYSSIDEILRECNSMAGQLDVWRLLDDAHDLVVTLHEKI